MDDGEKRTVPAQIEAALYAGNYEEVLRISDEAQDKRFLNREWEIISRFRALAAFVLAGGLGSQNKEMLELAKRAAEEAMSMGTASDSVPDGDYCFSLALYSQILYALAGEEKAINFIAKARSIYPKNCDLAAANSALYIQMGEYEIGASNAKLAIMLAEKEESLKKAAMAHWYLSLACKGLGKPDEARQQMEIALSLMKEAQTAAPSAAPAAVEHCIIEASEEIKKLTR